MPQATVKWFDETKGYGFLRPSEGGGDVFVHRRAVEASGLRSLDTGMRVEYILTDYKGKHSATDLKIVG